MKLKYKNVIASKSKVKLNFYVPTTGAWGYETAREKAYRPI